MSSTEKVTEQGTERSNEWTEDLAAVCIQTREWIQKHPHSYLGMVEGVWESTSHNDKIAFMNKNTLLKEAGKNALPIANILKFGRSIKNVLHIKRSKNRNEVGMEHLEPMHIKAFASLGIFSCPEEALFVEDELLNIALLVESLKIAAKYIPKLGPQVQAILEKISHGTKMASALSKEVLPKVRSKVRAHNPVASIQEGTRQRLQAA